MRQGAVLTQWVQLLPILLAATTQYCRCCGEATQEQVITSGANKLRKLQQSIGADDTSYWKPKPYMCWNYNLQGYTNLGDQPQSYLDFIEIDMEDNSPEDIRKLHDAGVRVVCYISTGSYENWRSDSGDFPERALGKDYDGWAGERWVDTTNPDVRDIMRRRIQLAGSKGCDGIEPDNMDGNDPPGKTGFDLSDAQALDFAIFIAGEVHARNMSVALKNAESLMPDAIPFYDFAINEQAIHYSELNKYSPWIEAGKPVFGIEYEYSNLQKDVCPLAESKGYSWLGKQTSVKAWVQPCGCYKGGIEVGDY